MKKLETMAIFAAVCTEGSFTGAARKMGLSKANISQQITQLEAVLGVQLLFRSTRRLELTEAGQVYLEYCHQVVEAARRSEEALESLSAEVQGTLRVTCPVSFGESFLNDIVIDFTRQYPNVRIELDLDNRVKDLKANDLDIAVRGGGQLDDDVVAIPAGNWREILCAAPGYLEKQDKLDHPDDLLAHNCLTNNHSRNAGFWRFKKGGQTIDVGIQGNYSVNNYLLLKKAVMKGVGIGRLPPYLITEELSGGSIVELLEGFKSEPRPIYVVYPYQRHLPLKNRRFIDFTVAWFREQVTLS